MAWQGRVLCGSVVLGAALCGWAVYGMAGRCKAIQGNPRHMKNSIPNFVTPLTENQEACVSLLEEALREARDGNIETIGIVVCMTDGFASVMAGHQAADLNLGCDSLKRKILDAIEGGNVRARTRSAILRAGVS
jgi:hypothetical protein